MARNADNYSIIHPTPTTSPTTCRRTRPPTRLTAQQPRGLTLKIGGVGSALIGWLVVRYKGVAYGTVEALLHACCGPALPAGGAAVKGLFYANLSGSVLAARDSVDYVTLTAAAGPTLFAALNAARADSQLQAYYCSVLNDRWTTDFGSERPRAVAERRTPAGVATW